MGEAVWLALVNRETWHAALAIMKDPDRLSPRGNQRMLTAVALCGVCEGPVHAGGNKGYPVYRCATSTGHFSRKAEPIDEYVSEVMIARLSRSDAADLFAPPRASRTSRSWLGMPNGSAANSMGSPHCMRKAY